MNATGVCLHIKTKTNFIFFFYRSEHGRWQRGGNASNNCTVFRQLGDKCEFIGTISKSKMFQFVIEDCKNRGIRISNCVYHENSEPPLSSVILNEVTGSRTIIHSNPDLPLLTFDDFRKINLNEYKWIHFEVNSRKSFLLEIQKKNKVIIQHHNIMCTCTCTCTCNKNHHVCKQCSIFICIYYHPI